MAKRISVIEQCSPTPEIRIGWFSVGGMLHTPEFSNPPGTTRPFSFLLENGCSPCGIPNRIPLNRWLFAAGPQMRRGPLEHPPGWVIFEGGQELPDAGSLRRVLYRRVHTRLQDNGRTQAVAAEIYIPSLGVRAPEPLGIVTKCAAHYSLELIERFRSPTPEIKTGWFFFGGLPASPTFSKAPG
jgi:hypothetical protein